MANSTDHTLTRSKLSTENYIFVPIKFLRQRNYYHQIMISDWNIDNMIKKSFFSGEGWFHLTDYINLQNRDPHEFQETQLQPVRIGVCLFS